MWLTAPYVPTAVVATLTMSAVVAGATRVHQGAHYPSDAAGGAVLGVALASALRYAVGRPPSR